MYAIVIGTYFITNGTGYRMWRHATRRRQPQMDCNPLHDNQL